MQKIKKDNLTDLVGEVTKPQETNPTPQPEQSDDLDDYQVRTPDGDVIDLTLQSADKSGDIKQILSGIDKKGNQYILVVQRKTS